MELVLTDVARRYGCTARTVQLAVQQGQLTALRQVGRTLVVDDLAAQAWFRSACRGRRWSPQIRDAALDLLSTGTTPTISGPSLSRLRARLRAMGAREIAHASGGLGAWARYETRDIAVVEPIGPSAVEMSELGIVGGAGWLHFGRTADLDALEADADIRLDASGNLGVVERSTSDGRIARILLDAYLLGDARVSAAAAQRLEELAHAL